MKNKSMKGRIECIYGISALTAIAKNPLDTMLLYKLFKGKKK